MIKHYPRYKYLVLGGTFDRFHSGHRSLIDIGLRLSENLIIGITKKNLYENKAFANQVEAYKIRRKNLENYLINKKVFKRTKVLPISDIYGTTLTDDKLEAILVSKETEKNALLINKHRQKAGLKPLKIITAPYILGNDKKVVSSERIRRGEIDRKGLSYLSLFNKPVMILPENLRDQLRKPIGQVIKTTRDLIRKIKANPPEILISVGDIITLEILKKDYIPQIQVIDLKSRRLEIDSRSIQFLKQPVRLNRGLLERKKTINLAGTINIKSVKAIKLAINRYLKTERHQQLIINGEEDLLTLPAILLAPLGSVVVYGHYQLGIIWVDVSEGRKKFVTSLVKRFI